MLSTVDYFSQLFHNTDYEQPKITETNLSTLDKNGQVKRDYLLYQADNQIQIVLNNFINTYGEDEILKFSWSVLSRQLENPVFLDDYLLLVVEYPLLQSTHFDISRMGPTRFKPQNPVNLLVRN